jgi:hypothetical protein
MRASMRIARYIPVPVKYSVCEVISNLGCAYFKVSVSSNCFRALKEIKNETCHVRKASRRFHCSGSATGSLSFEASLQALAFRQSRQQSNSSIRLPARA